MRQPPRDARAPFTIGAMGRSILLAAAGLFAAVAVAYEERRFRTLTTYPETS
jgi:hypothetical protein